MAHRSIGLVGLLLALPLGGCACYPRAQNPLPGVFRVAVVDFVDKTNGSQGVDTRRITEIFASELQKIPTYEVVPVQEVREVLGPARIDTNQPQLAYELARAVHAQAIIVGSVNEYSAYYPPRIGLHCEWYAMVTGEPEAIVESPPIEVEQDRQPIADVLDSLPRPGRNGGKVGHGHGHGHGHGCGKCAGCQAGSGCGSHRPIPRMMAWVRTKFGAELPMEAAAPAGSTTAPPASAPKASPPAAPGAAPGEEKVPEEARRGAVDRGIVPVSAQVEELPALPAPVTAPQGEGAGTNDPPTPADPQVVLEEEPLVSLSGAPAVTTAGGTATEYLAGQIPDYLISVQRPVDPIPIVEPWVIRHSRVFDGTNIGLTRKLKDYYFFANDLRGGNWQGYVLRNDDFIRFSCNQMIYEMLEAAGGQWMTLWGVRIPTPWDPWPPR